MSFDDYYCALCRKVPVLVRGGICVRCAPEQMPARPPSALILYTVYRRPSDFPSEFVVRRWAIQRLMPTHDGGPPFARGSSLAEVRRALPEGLYCMGREAGDDPVIVETWL